jgi:type I restriction enzyme S subunit
MSEQLTVREAPASYVLDKQRVKPGYKQTEVGVIPEDWEVKLLRDVVDFANGKPHEGNVEVDGRYCLITLDSIGIDGKLKAEHKRTNISDSSLSKNDIVSVLSDLAHGNLLGLCDLIPAGETYVLNQRMGRLRLKMPADAQFVRLQINRRQAHFRKRGQGTSQKHIYKRDFDDLPIPIPETTEQQAIAEALSDADALIAALEQLIAKKRHLKQGAMQELLTGKKRLPGFSGEWETKRFGDVGATYGGLTSKTKADFGEGAARYITFMNVMTNVVIDCGMFEHVRVSPVETQNRAKKGDLFFNGSSETPEEVAMCAVLLEEVQDVYLNSFCFGFRFREGAEADGVFFAYYLRSREGRELMKSLAQGSTRYNLSKVALLNSLLRLPALPEQTAIATILTDMDTEIAVLEQQLAKARGIKQGMMQELLTGRIRLV